MRRPKRVVRAYASSRWIGFVSSDSSLKSLTSASWKVLEISLASPTRLCAGDGRRAVERGRSER